LLYPWFFRSVRNRHHIVTLPTDRRFTPLLGRSREILAAACGPRISRQLNRRSVHQRLRPEAEPMPAPRPARTAHQANKL